MRHYPWMVLLATAVASLAAGCNGAFSGPVKPEEYIGKEPPLTLLLAEFRGPQARSLAERACDGLHQRKFPAAYVLADDDEAFLCHSRYSGLDDSRYGPDVKRIAEIRDREGKSLFGRTWLAPLPELTPPTPYPLTEARGKYTVQVGLFDLYGRKAAAVQVTEELRRKGYEAYTHHDETQSQVTIGAFGDIIFDNPARRFTPNDPPKIVSPDVRKILATFPLLNLNGHTLTRDEAAKIHVTRRGFNPKTGRYEEAKVDVARYARSQLVHIPRKVVSPTQPSPPPTSPTPTGPILRPPSRW